MEYQAASYDYIIDEIEFFPRESAKQKKRPPRIPKVKYLFLNNKNFCLHSTYAQCNIHEWALYLYLFTYKTTVNLFMTRYC